MSPHYSTQLEDDTITWQSRDHHVLLSHSASVAGRGWRNHTLVTWPSLGHHVALAWSSHGHRVVFTPVTERVDHYGQAEQAFVDMDPLGARFAPRVACARQPLGASEVDELDLERGGQLELVSNWTWSAESL